MPVCIGPVCILINALTQAQNNSVRISKKNYIYIYITVINNIECSSSSCSGIFLHDVLLNYGILHHTHYFV